MKYCERCGKPSVYHSTLIVNGVSQTTDLCRDCAIKEGVFSNGPENFFEDVFAPFGEMLGFEQVENIVCPVCKTSLREFKASHKLGCPNCYETFAKEIGQLISKIAPNGSHKQTCIKETNIDVSNSLDDKTAEKIAALRAEMAQAVSEERYEDAAKLKKKIQKLEKEDE